MPAPAAAYYLGISETKLRELPIPRRVSGGNRLYHITDLDAYADSLPMEGGAAWESEEADRAFGAGR
jgi:hypothetical protein